MSAFPSDGLITSTLNLIKTDTPFLALFSTNPNSDGSGTEITGGSYARQSVTFGTIASGSMSNTNTIEFEDMPATTAAYWAIFDAVSGGNLLAYGEMDSPVVSQAGDTATIQSGDITLSFSGS